MVNKSMSSGPGDSSNAKRPSAVRRNYFFDQLPIGAIIIDPDCNIVDLNDIAIADFALDVPKIIGNSLFTIFEDRSYGKSATEFLHSKRPIKEQEFETLVRGEKTFVLISSASIDNEANDKSETCLFIRDITRKRKREGLLAYLSRAAATLVSQRDTATALETLAELIVPSFADWFTVDVLKDGHFEPILLKHEDPEKVEWAHQYRESYPPDPAGSSYAAQVIKTGEPVFIPRLTEEMIDMRMADTVQRNQLKKIGLHSVIMAPMSYNGRTTGLVNFISSRSDRHFDEEDLDFAKNFANLINVSLENARLNEEAQREIEQRREQEENLRFLLDAIPHKIWTSAPDGHATYYNKQWHEYTGITGFENLRAKVWGIIHPDDLADAALRWPQAVQSGEDMQMEHRFQGHDGEYRWHLSRVSAVKDSEGAVVFWIGTSTDIHEQKIYELELASANEEITASNEELSAANEELEAFTVEQSAANDELTRMQEKFQTAIVDLENSKRRFEVFLDSIPHIAWSGAADGEVSYYNERWYQYTGLTFEETGNWGWKQVIHPEDLEYTVERLSYIVKSQEPGEFEIREKGADGIYRWHLVRIRPIVDSQGRLEQWVGTATDIDELKKLQQQKDDFISIASHELKTPLTTLRTAIQLLYSMRENPSPEKFRKLIEHANRSMYKMSTLVDDLLNVNRFKEAHLAPDKHWFVLSELVNACCNHIVVAGRHEVVIRGDKSLQVHADERAIDQVVVNFVNNAVKYGPLSKIIEIVIEKHGSGVKLSVGDNGPGIKPEQLPFVFERYYQGGKQDYKNPGLGLGLYISSEIIKRHEGTIGVESEVGNGSTFWFTLPEAR